MRARRSLRRQVALSGAVVAIGAGLAAAGPGAAIAPDATGGATGAATTIDSLPAENNKPIGPLSTDPAAVSTIVVPAGTQDVIRDIDVRTFITHTASGDLDIELTSPQGTTVKLIAAPPTSAAIGNDDSFNGTVWDDSASTLASDGPYPAPSGVAPTLVPEGALGAFVGEDPAGTWTLRVTDTSPPTVPPAPPETDGGTLVSWQLIVSTQDTAPTTVTTNAASSGGPVAISDPPAGAATKQITVSGAKDYLWDLNLETDITHTSPSDLEIRLTGPTGRTAVISTRTTGPTTFFASRPFDDNAPALITSSPAAGPAVPEGALAAFMGTDPNGTWTLSVEDFAAADEGTLDGWSLTLESTDATAPSTPTPPTNPPTTPPSSAPITSEQKCLPTPPTPSSGGSGSPGKVEVSVAQLRINQRIYQAAIRRANAIQDWLDAGLVADDFCGGAISASLLGPGITTGNLAQAQTLTPPAPRPITVKPASTNSSARFQLTSAQFLINQRVAQAAVRRANGLQKRLAGSLTGGDVRDGQITQAKLNSGLAIVSAQQVGTPPAASVTPIAASTPGKAGSVERSAAQLLINQRIGQAAIRRLNALTAQLSAGIATSNVKPGSITAVDLAPGLRP